MTRRLLDVHNFRKQSSTVDYFKITELFELKEVTGKSHSRVWRNFQVLALTLLAAIFFAATPLVDRIVSAIRIGQVTVTKIFIEHFRRTEYIENSTTFLIFHDSRFRRSTAHSQSIQLIYSRKSLKVPGKALRTSTHTVVLLTQITLT